LTDVTHLQQVITFLSKTAIPNVSSRLEIIHLTFLNIIHEAMSVCRCLFILFHNVRHVIKKYTSIIAIIAGSRAISIVHNLRLLIEKCVCRCVIDCISCPQGEGDVMQREFSYSSELSYDNYCIYLRKSVTICMLFIFICFIVVA
jgi:hypothetical protein